MHIFQLEYRSKDELPVSASMVLRMWRVLMNMAIAFRAITTLTIYRHKSSLLETYDVMTWHRALFFVGIGFAPGSNSTHSNFSLLGIVLFYSPSQERVRYFSSQEETRIFPIRNFFCLTIKTAGAREKETSAAHGRRRKKISQKQIETINLWINFWNCCFFY